MSNSIAPGSSADVNVRVTALTTNPNVPVTYKTVILKKNLVNGVNTLTQEMMSATNTKYVIKYDYTLGEDITVPENCILEFDGGSLKNHKINGNNTRIEAALVKIADTTIDFIGTWDVPTCYVEWFGMVGDDSTDNTSIFQYILYNNISEKILITTPGTYRFNEGIVCVVKKQIIGLRDKTILKYTGSGSFITLGTASRECNFVFNELTFDGNNTALDIFHMVKMARCTFNRITAMYAKTILNANHNDFVYGIYTSFTSCMFAGADNGVYLSRPQGWLNCTSFYDCSVTSIGYNLPDSSEDGNAFTIEAHSLSIIHCTVDTAIRGFVLPQGKSSLGCVFINNHVEGIRKEPVYLGNTGYETTDNQIVFCGNYFAANIYSKPFYSNYIKYERIRNRIIFDTDTFDEYELYETKIVYKATDKKIEDFVYDIVAIKAPFYFKYKIKTAPISGSTGYIGIGLKNTNKEYYKLPFNPQSRRIENLTTSEENTVITLDSATSYTVSQIHIVTSDSLLYKCSNVLDYITLFTFFEIDSINNEKIINVSISSGATSITIPTNTLNDIFPNVKVGNIILLRGGVFMREHSLSTTVGAEASGIIDIPPMYKKLSSNWKDRLCGSLHTNYRGLVFEYIELLSMPNYKIEKGTSSERPIGKHNETIGSETIEVGTLSASEDIGFQYFDTSLSPARPIYAKAINNTTGVVTWVDATGATV